MQGPDGDVCSCAGPGALEGRFSSTVWADEEHHRTRRSPTRRACGPDPREGSAVGTYLRYKNLVQYRSRRDFQTYKGNKLTKKKIATLMWYSILMTCSITHSKLNSLSL